MSDITMALNVFVLLSIFLFHFTQAKVLNLSCEQIRQIVDGHNNRRLDLANGNVEKQPAASEMKSVVWDRELAAKASKWSANNKFEINPETSINSKRFTTGENLSRWVSSNKNYELNVSKVLDSWFDENKNYTYGPITKSVTSTSYTQMVWSNSTYIGCGVSQKQDADSVEYLVVCNYGPAGNILNETPYKSGPASYEYLCATGDCRHPYGDMC